MEDKEKVLRWNLQDIGRGERPVGGSGGPALCIECEIRDVVARGPVGTRNNGCIRQRKQPGGVDGRIACHLHPRGHIERIPNKKGPLQ